LEQRATLVAMAQRARPRDLRESGRWRPAGSWRGEAKVAARPFEAVPFELAALWAG
jgi:hypothetical protein